MINLGGGWTGNWAIHDPMFNNINYQYDIYHGNKDNRLLCLFPH